MKQITHRANTRFNEYVKMDGRWFKVTFQALPAPLENYELVTSLQHCQYLDRIAEPVKEENAKKILPSLLHKQE